MDREHGDPRFRDAALDLARTFAAAQDPEDGAWPGRDRYKYFESSWPGGAFGPSEARINSGESVLWFLGRVRKELGVEEFIPNEAKAQGNRIHGNYPQISQIRADYVSKNLRNLRNLWIGLLPHGVEFWRMRSPWAKANKWVQTYCLPEMFWQNVGWHSLEMIPVQDTVAPHALSYCTWQLDYADAKDKDLRMVMEIARWCEERHVNWDRQLGPYESRFSSRPSCWGWGRAAGTGIRVAGSLVYVWTRLWQETKDPLWKAKADALAQGILVSQDPVDGAFGYHFNRSTRDTRGFHQYDLTDAAYRLMDYSRLTAGKP